MPADRTPEAVERMDKAPWLGPPPCAPRIHPARLEIAARLNKRDFRDKPSVLGANSMS